MKKPDLIGLALWVVLAALAFVAGSQRIATDFYSGLEHPARPISPTAPLQ